MFGVIEYIRIDLVFMKKSQKLKHPYEIYLFLMHL